MQNSLDLLFENLEEGDKLTEMEPAKVRLLYITADAAAVECQENCTKTLMIILMSVLL